MRHRPVSIRTIVGVAAYLCPSLTHFVCFFAFFVLPGIRKAPGLFSSRLPACPIQRFTSQVGRIRWSYIVAPISRRVIRQETSRNTILYSYIRPVVGVAAYLCPSIFSVIYSVLWTPVSQIVSTSTCHTTVAVCGS